MRKIKEIYESCEKSQKNSVKSRVINENLKHLYEIEGNWKNCKRNCEWVKLRKVKKEVNENRIKLGEIVKKIERNW